MSVKIRMKKLGRRHRPFYRICAIETRKPRHGKVLEELGTYDPMIGDTDARTQLNRERVAHWLSVGAQPSDKVAVLIKKYGENGTHVELQEAALAKLAQPKSIPDPGAPASLPKQPESEQPAAAEAAPAEAEATEAAAEAPAEEQSEVTAEAPAEESTESTSEEEKPADE
ncbi:MAG: 30S ribosomal protein S16 [Planctomycetales bacterium]|nr:30S ribosomal protein S16 [Planctomycetales bacterium]